MRRVRAGCAAWRCDVNPWGDAVRAYGRALAVLAARERGKQLKPVGVEVKGIPRTVFPAVGPIRVNEVPREVYCFEQALQ